MKTLFAAVALSIAIPAIAHAQSTPAPEAKMEKMKCKMDCCKDKMGDKAQDGHAMKSGHDMKSGTAPQADPHQNHQK